jgi:DeoR/GlpR family transcriptional regulator of sugar metabolism
MITTRPEDILLPRRREILEIIRDHRMVSFDFIKRRFPGICQSTLHYDIKQLLRAGLVRKLGATRGAQYVTINESPSDTIKI